MFYKWLEINGLSQIYHKFTRHDSPRLAHEKNVKVYQNSCCSLHRETILSAIVFEVLLYRKGLLLKFGHKTSLVCMELTAMCGSPIKMGKLWVNSRMPLRWSCKPARTQGLRDCVFNSSKTQDIAHIFWKNVVMLIVCRILSKKRERFMAESTRFCLKNAVRLC